MISSQRENCLFCTLSLMSYEKIADIEYFTLIVNMIFQTFPFHLFNGQGGTGEVVGHKILCIEGGHILCT